MSRLGEAGGSAAHISTTRPILCSGCDNCNEWFHGDCIRITEKMAKAIREWYCRECRGEGWNGQGRQVGLRGRGRSRGGRLGHGRGGTDIRLAKKLVCFSGGKRALAALNCL